MLTRSLFEDVIVAHWLVFNYDDPDWLAARFLRQREAIALHQQTLEKEMKMGMGVPLPAPDDLGKRAQALRGEFRHDARRDWWDPARRRGNGKDVGIRKIAKELEQAAAEHKMFHPRFAGGDAAVLTKTERVVNKWLSQCTHHTAIGLPFTPVNDEEIEVPEDPMLTVAFRAAWLYAQQVYLLQEIEKRDLRPVEAIWMYCLAGFVKVWEGRDGEENVEAAWDELWGKGQTLEEAAWLEHLNGQPLTDAEPPRRRWWRGLRKKRVA